MIKEIIEWLDYGRMVVYKDENEQPQTVSDIEFEKIKKIEIKPISMG